MKCRKAESLLAEYMDGSLKGALRARLEAHLADCRVCARTLESIRKMVCSLGQLSSEGPGFSCWEGVRERIAAAQVPNPIAWWAWASRPLFATPVLALALLVVVAVLGPIRLGNTPTAQMASNPELNTYITAHSHMQRQQVFTDPDVAFLTAEMQKASLVTYEPKK